MNCKKCGRNNPPNAKYCVYCASPLPKPQKNALHSNAGRSNSGDSIIIAIIIALIFVLVVGAIVYFYNYKPYGGNGFRSGGGGGGGAISSGANILPGMNPGGKVPHPPTEEPPRGEAPPQPPGHEKPSETDSEPDEEAKKKQIILDYFSIKAYEIEEYEKEHLDTATNQYEMNTISATVYEKWDALLNEIYEYLKENMPENEFKKLEKEELEWIKEKEAAVEEAGKAWEGGSGEPFARNMTAIRYTKDRFYELINMI